MARPQLIRAHHERWDGMGYPDGLSGLAIPMGARILALANDYDAVQIGTLLSKRLTQSEAVDLYHRGPRQTLRPPGGGCLRPHDGRAGQPAVAEMELKSAQLKPGMSPVTRPGNSRRESCCCRVISC